jgi:hypothetical protein
MYVLVSFYMQPNDALPQFANASQIIQQIGFDPPVVFAQVNIEQNRELASQYNVTNASLIWFLRGQPKPYAGISLQSDDISFWVMIQVDTFTVPLTEQVLAPSGSPNPKTNCNSTLRAVAPSEL